MARLNRFHSILKTFLAGAGFFFFLLPTLVWAQDPCAGGIRGCNCAALDYADPKNICLYCVFICLLGRLVNFLLGLAPAVATLLLVIGGVRYMASGGDERSLQSIRQFLTWAVVGFLLVLGVFFVLRVVTGLITE